MVVFESQRTFNCYQNIASMFCYVDIDEFFIFLFDTKQRVLIQKCVYFVLLF